MAEEKADLNAGPIQKVTTNSGPKKQSQVEMILKWHKDAKKWRSNFDCNWKMWLNAYKGQTWNSGDTSATGFQQKTSNLKQQPEINIIRSTIQSTIPILTDNRPGFNPIPPQPADYSFSKMLGEQVESIWDRQSMPIKIVEIITDMEILNHAVAKVTWDTELEDGLGDVKIEVVNPDNIYVPRGTIDFDRNCGFVIERFYKQIGELKRKFPKKADKIRSDSTSQDKKDQGWKGSAMDGTMTVVSPVDQDSNKVDNKAPDLADSNEIVEVWEVWYQDSTLEDYELETGEKGKRKKYPNGHLVTMLPNQKLELQSVRNPYEGTQWNPYVNFVDTIVPRCIYGEGQAEPLMDVQKVINKTCQNILEIMRLMSNPVWIGDKTAGVNWKKITNKIGLILLKEKGSELKRDFPPGIDRSLFEVLQTWMRFADIVSGIQDVTQGRKPAGVTAAEAIETLQEAAQTRIRLKERNLNQSLSKMAKMIINRVLQYYRGVRYQRIAGENIETPDFIEFNIEPIEIDGDEGVQMTKKRIVWDAEAQQYIEAPEGLTTAQSTKTSFDVEVASGSSMPFQKAQRASVAFRLFDAGVLSAEGLLDSVDWPDKDKELQRMEERQAAQAAAQPAPQLG